MLRIIRRLLVLLTVVSMLGHSTSASATIHGHAIATHGHGHHHGMTVATQGESSRGEHRCPNHHNDGKCCDGLCCGASCLPASIERGLAAGRSIHVSTLQMTVGDLFVDGAIICLPDRPPRTT